MPEGERAYVIGDVHGRNDLLRCLLDRITVDAAARETGKTHLIFLGDYVDRGRESAGVIETILNLEMPEMNVVALKGNHETCMLAFLDDPIKGKRWLHYGGDATLRSYGIEVSVCDLTEEKIKDAAGKFEKTLPVSHREFLEKLNDKLVIGDYFFVHAGIDPGRSLEKQKARDLHWIRDEFLSHQGLYEKIIVHGHSIIPEPEFKSNRIGIDTGAFYSGNLTCLVLEGTDKDIL